MTQKKNYIEKSVTMDNASVVIGRSCYNRWDWHHSQNERIIDLMNVSGGA